MTLQDDLMISLQEQLQEANAAIARLRGALKKIAESCNLTTTSCCQWPHEIAIDVLADTTPSEEK